MGYDKLLSFFTKNLQNTIIEELYNKPIISANHIYFDINFMVYNSISVIENDINIIYKMIFALTYTDSNIIQEQLTKIFSSFHWNKVIKKNNIDMMEILDGLNVTIILQQFKDIIDKYVYDLLYWDVFNSINNSIKHNHIIDFINTINLFLDGIPTYAKIIEQRRRRMKNYLDSKNRKKIFKQYFNDIICNLITEEGITYDYFEWLKYLYSFDKSIGPYSNIMILLGDFIIEQLQLVTINNILVYKNIKITLNNSTNFGESDYKIFKHIKDNKIDGSICIHSCDSDFIFMIIWHQLMCNVSSIDCNIMLINYNKKSSNILIYAKK